MTTRSLLEKAYAVIIEVNNGDDVASLSVLAVTHVNLVVLYCTASKCTILRWRDASVLAWRVSRERPWTSKKKLVSSALPKDN